MADSDISLQDMTAVPGARPGSIMWTKQEASCNLACESYIPRLQMDIGREAHAKIMRQLALSEHVRRGRARLMKVRRASPPLDLPVRTRSRIWSLARL